MMTEAEQKMRNAWRKLFAWFGTLKAETVLAVGAGCWVLFGYLSHDREAKYLQVEQQRLATEQARAVQQTAIDTGRAHLQQLKLSNEQSRLALAVAESQRKLREIELRQSLKLQEQEIALKALQARKTEHEVDYQGRFRFGQTYELTGRKVGGDTRYGTYELSHRFELANKSETAFELSLYVVDYYIGVPKQDAAGDEPSVLPLGEPANRWNPRGAKPGGVEWTRVGHSGAIVAAAVGNIPKPWCDAADVEHLVPGGPGTGVLQPMQSIRHGDTYVVRAPRHSYVTFIVSFCTNRCQTNDDLYWRTDVLGLDELETEQSAKK